MTSDDKDKSDSVHKTTSLPSVFPTSNDASNEPNNNDDKDLSQGTEEVNVEVGNDNNKADTTRKPFSRFGSKLRSQSSYHPSTLSPTAADKKKSTEYRQTKSAPCRRKPSSSVLDTVDCQSEREKKALEAAEKRNKTRQEIIQVLAAVDQIMEDEKNAEDFKEKTAKEIEEIEKMKGKKRSSSSGPVSKNANSDDDGSKNKISKPN